MSTIDSTMEQRTLRLTRILAGALVILAPAIYLAVAAVIKPGQPTMGAAATQLLITLLLVVACIQPAMGLLIERFQIKSFQTSGKTAMTAASLFQAVTILKLAFVEAVFIYGLVVYLLCANMTPMLWFYLVGAVWAVIYWPRKGRFEEFLKKVNVS